MRVLLLHPERTFDAAAAIAPNAADLVADLELDVVFDAMAAGDRQLRDQARAVLLASLVETAAIRHRQAILADCLERPDVVREIHAIAVEAIVGEAQVWGAFLDQYAESVLARATKVLELFAGLLRRLRRLTDAHAAEFESPGFRRLFATLAAELDDDYLATVDEHLVRLRFRHGMVLSARLGTGNRGTGYVLRKPRETRADWRQRVAILDRAGYTYTIPDQSENAARAFTALKSEGISQAAAAIAEATDQILGFFTILRFELGFYVGCLNLEERLGAVGVATCMPEASDGPDAPLSARGLCDVSLALTLPGSIVGNDLDATGRPLIVITGANRGGKTSLLRAAGQAQLMLQAGMRVAAGTFRTDVRRGIFTHFKREEDASLQSGKLDEELRRMSAIVDRLTPTSLLLLNESFASTNEREGAEIARQIVGPLLDTGARVAVVTHLFDLADGFAREADAGSVRACFLRAERRPDGERTFRLVEGRPLPTSFGGDVYRRVFGVTPDGLPAHDGATQPAPGSNPAALPDPAPNPARRAPGDSSPDSGGPA